MTEVDITNLTHDGRGVAHIDGKAVFVTGALPGERVRIALTRRSRSRALARTRISNDAAPLMAK